MSNPLLKINKVVPARGKELKLKDKTPSDFPLKKLFTLSIIGSSRTGKTNCIVDILLKLAKCYKNVFVFTSSPSDDKWTALSKFDNIYIGKVVSNKILLSLLDKHEKFYLENPENNHSILVLDDVGIFAKINGQEIDKKQYDFSTGIRPALDKIYSMGRHSGLSVLATYHDVMQMSPVSRVNSTAFLLYRLNQRQYERIAPELRCHLSEKEFVQLADESTIKPFSFLLVNLRALENKDVFVQSG